MILFAYHSGAQQLFLSSEATGGAPAAYRTTDLRRMGWTVNDDDLLKSLPRVDAPQVQIAPASALQGLRRGRR